MPGLLLTWTTPVDPGGGNPGRNYESPPIGAGFFHLYTVTTAQQNNSSAALSAGTYPTIGTTFYRRYPQPAPAYTDHADNQNYVTLATDTLIWQVNDASPGGGQITVQLWGDPAPAATICQYGTQIQPTAPATIFLDNATLALILSPFNMEWIAPIFSFLIGTYIANTDLCSRLPPPMPQLDLNTPNLSTDSLRQLFDSLAWPHYCQCTPGTPNPTPPTSPGQPEPAGWPTTPAVTCSNTDVCALLTTMAQQLNQLLQVVGSNYQLTTLVQRYRVPFATIVGSTHPNVSGSGSFGISRLIGMKFQLNAPLSGWRTFEGNPEYLIDVGWMAVSTPAGMVAEQRITRGVQQWFPELMQEALSFNYLLNPGVIGSFTELEAEP